MNTLHELRPTPRLPVEVRLRIWRYAVQRPRVHNFHIARDGKPVLSATSSLAGSTITMRAVLSTCTESREEALRALPEEIVFYHGKKQYALRYDPESHIIVLADVDLEQLRLITTTWRRIRADETGKEKPPPRRPRTRHAAAEPSLAEQKASLSWMTTVQRLGFGVGRLSACPTLASLTLALADGDWTMPQFLNETCPVVEFVFIVGTAAPQMPDSLVPKKFKYRRGGNGETIHRGAMAKPGRYLSWNQETYWPERWQWIRGQDRAEDWYGKFYPVVLREYCDRTKSSEQANYFSGICDLVDSRAGIGHPGVPFSWIMHQLGWTEEETMRMRVVSVWPLLHFVGTTSLPGWRDDGGKWFKIS